MRYPRQTLHLLFVAGTIVSAAAAFDAPKGDLATQARAELYAARYDKAVELYRALLSKEPGADCYDELMRALIEAHSAKAAYALAGEALARAPQTAGTQTAAGLAMYRKGDIGKAENYFRAALKIDPKHPGALTGLASIYSAVSNPRTARDLLNRAYTSNPEDPALMRAHANTLKGDEHIAALEKLLAVIDAATEEARDLRVHIAVDRAIHGRKVRRLVSAYQPARLKLVQILNGVGRFRGFGLRVQFNHSYTGTLMLDTGASGISIAPKSAQKAGLELLSGLSNEAQGIGDKEPDDSLGYLASEIRVGDVILADHPVAVFRSAKDSDVHGLIGADVFQKFIITLDFRYGRIELQPYATPEPDEPVDATSVPAGFHRVFRAGNHLLMPTQVNDSPNKFFVIDSGSSANLIDIEAAREFTGVHSDSRTDVRGIQGKVDKVSRADRINLKFAGFVQDNPDLVAIDLEKLGDAMGIAVTGVLGMPVIGQLRLTIDYREGAVKLMH